MSNQTFFNTVKELKNWCKENNCKSRKIGSSAYVDYIRYNCTDEYKNVYYRYVKIV